MRKEKPGALFIAAGLLMIGAALLLCLYNLWDARRAEAAAEEAVDQLVEVIPTLAPTEETREPVVETTVDPNEVFIPDFILDPNRDMPVKTIKKKDYIGTLSIPKLDLELPVISSYEEEALKTAPCRFSGSVYLNDMVICGHNYTTHFAGLRKLAEGDEVSFTDMDGNIFRYTVAALEQLKPDQTADMLSGDWDLTLFTCNFTGGTRLTVRCALSETIPWQELEALTDNQPDPS